MEISLTYRENNNGPRAVPSGKQDKIGAHSDILKFTAAHCCITKKGIYPSECLAPMPLPNKSRTNVSNCPPLSKILSNHL